MVYMSGYAANHWL